MGTKTSLYDQHVELKAQIVEFAGYDLPMHYGSQINEHQKVREHAGMFDVSHMNIVDIKGIDAKKFCGYVLANNVDKIKPFQALYSCMLNKEGHVIDDLIAYMYAENHYRLILNGATREKDMRWLNEQAKAFSIDILPQVDLSIIALQGPKAMPILASLLAEKMTDKTLLNQLKPFHFCEIAGLMIARTGYTGEDGFEIIVKNNEAPILWRALYDAGVQPAGLGARDSLRLEAGYNLYGQDMDETTSPLESNLTWTIALLPEDREFMGRQALESFKANPSGKKLVGIKLEKGGILRRDQKIVDKDGNALGVLTSGGFSPVLNCSVGFARIKMSENPNTEAYFVNIRDKLLPVKITRPSFVKNGKAVENQ